MKYLFILFPIICSILSCSSFEDQITCLVEGTPVITPDGTSPIEKLKVGDKVLSYDTEKKSVITNTITRIKTSKTNTTIKLLLNNEMSIEGTGDHPVFLPDKNIYVEIKTLKAGDKLLKRSSENATIETIGLNYYQDQVNVYDISVMPPFHNYFAGHILVHNKSH